MRLSGKIALITGSSRGIGRGIAVEMAKEGADIVVNYLSHEDEARKVAEQARGMGRRALVCYADVSKREDVEKLVEATLEEFGRVDICVSNVGRTIRKPFVELTPEDFEWVMRASCFSVFNVCQLCARDMVKRGKGGAILIISSVHSFVPIGTSVPYNTAKAGINHMAATMAEELAPHRIRVNVIDPGWIDTPGERELCTEEELQEEARKLPWGRLGRPEEVGKAAVFLCSDDADYITAAALGVDGGFWLPSRGKKLD
jgi:glucose 1-dehydrogenase